MSNSPTSQAVTPKLLEINAERIDQWVLMRALCRISDRQYSIEQTGYEEEEWKAFVGYGNVNDRQWRERAVAPTLVGLLTVLGAKDG